jgi:hypothetical protein
MLGVQRGLWRRGLRRWAPLAAGVMLLAFLGIEGEHIDIGAHVAGLVAGGAIGLALAPAAPRLAPRRDAAFGGAAVALLVAAWALALAAPQ